MPHARNGDTRVRFEELGGPRDAPALALVFGFGMTLHEWAEFGYVARLQDRFRLVAIEPRGHGGSSSPRAPEAYRLDDLASDVLAVLDHLELSRALVWGYSLGAKIALALAAARPERVSGLVLGGLELRAAGEPRGDLVTDTLARGGDAWRALWQQMFAVPPATAERLARVDAPALIALRRAEFAWDSLADAARRVAAPCLLYAGEACFFRDATRDAARLFARSRYVERAGANHFAVMLEAAWICREVAAESGRLS